MRGLCLHLRLFIPVNTKLTWFLRVASYTFKNISYQARGQKKGRRNFEPFDKGKRASRKFKWDTFGYERRASQFHSCQEKLWREGAMKWQAVANAVRPEMNTNTVIPGCSICLCMSVSSPGREITHQLPPELQPDPHSTISNSWVAVLLQPPSANTGLPSTSPQTAPIMGFAHFVIPVIEP